MPALTVTPNPAPPSTLVAVAGSGFANAKTRLLLDGAGSTTNIFRPRKDGTFNVGITVASSARTQTLIAQQQSGSTWSTKASTSIVVKAVVEPPPPNPLPTSLQAAIDATPTGGLLDVTGGIYREQVTIGKPITLKGGTIDGQNVRFGLRVRSSDVTVVGLAVLNAKLGSMYEGAVDCRGGVSRFKFSGTVTGSNAMGMWVEGGSGHAVNADVSGHAQTGVHFHALTDSTLTGKSHGNGASADVGNESGGAKIVVCQRTTVSDFEAYLNIGPGVWWDGFITALAQRVNAHDNSWPGIMFEAGRYGQAFDSVLDGNWKGQNPDVDIVHTGAIRVSSCSDITIQRNILRNGIWGVTLLAQDRSDSTGANMGVPRKPETGIVVTGNTISGMSKGAINVHSDYASQAIYSSVVSPNP